MPFHTILLGLSVITIHQHAYFYLSLHIAQHKIGQLIVFYGKIVTFSENTTNRLV